MKKRVFIVLAALLVAVLGLAVWEGLHKHEPEPVYKGKPLGYWIRRTGEIGPGMLGPRFGEVPALDSAAVPFLARYLERPQSPFRQLFNGVYTKTWFKLPAWAARPLPRPIDTDVARRNTLWLLCRLGTNAAPAIPALVRVLKEDKPWLNRFAAASALQPFAKTDGTARRALIEVLADKHPDVRSVAAGALANAGLAKEEVEAALRRYLSDPDPNVRAWTTNFLRQVSATTRE